MSMRLIVALLAVAFMSGCAHDTKKAEPGLPTPVEDVFYAEPETVDRAIAQVMVKYPQKIANLEAGILETDQIKGDLRFRPAHKEVRYGSGYRYKIAVRTVKGRNNGRPAIKVQVTKFIEQQRDFFADPEQLKSDLLEEKVILYRIGREIKIDRAMQRYQQKTSHFNY